MDWSRKLSTNGCPPFSIQELKQWELPNCGGSDYWKALACHEAAHLIVGVRHFGDESLSGIALCNNSGGGGVGCCGLDLKESASREQKLDYFMAGPRAHRHWCEQVGCDTPPDLPTGEADLQGASRVVDRLTEREIRLAIERVDDIITDSGCWRFIIGIADDLLEREPVVVSDEPYPRWFSESVRERRSPFRCLSIEELEPWLHQTG